MYSYEIKNLLVNNNYFISNQDYFKIIQSSPQIRRIEFNNFNKNFKIETRDGYDFNFKVYKKEIK